MMVIGSGGERHEEILMVGVGGNAEAEVEAVEPPKKIGKTPVCLLFLLILSGFVWAGCRLYGSVKTGATMEMKFVTGIAGLGFNAYGCFIADSISLADHSKYPKIIKSVIIFASCALLGFIHCFDWNEVTELVESVTMGFLLARMLSIICEELECMKLIGMLCVTVLLYGMTWMAHNEYQNTLNITAWYLSIWISIASAIFQVFYLHTFDRWGDNLKTSGENNKFLKREVAKKNREIEESKEENRLMNLKLAAEQNDKIRQLKQMQETIDQLRRDRVREAAIPI